MKQKIEENIARFRADVSREENRTLIDRYYYSTVSPVLTNDQQAALRRSISNRFEVSVPNIIMVGSAKLGFTLRAKPTRPPLSHFSDNSDIDVAIVSQTLFVSYWEAAFSYWLEKKDWAKAAKFKEYLFRGWVRPDLLPADRDFALSTEWFEYFRSLQASGLYGGYKIAAGIYLNEHFWEKYVSSALTECRLHLEELT
ncbi:hypothetical protein GHK33_20210 [Sinorhizobium meliloti]|uniref:hypothetical protein n=1 Tax=Rhizobium meliloti TaxID=382 RepID=UPI0012972EC5|nr:hypothetical protein [Sinorhizobium meliloti]MQW64875.1 hypothetical protein [Sinorhizobium meliloti]